MKHLFDENLPIPLFTKPVAEAIVRPVVPMKSASLESHVKLQQYQEEFLTWLEEQENQDEQGNSYSFRKIR